MIQKRYQSSINLANTRSYPGASIHSDYNLVLMQMKLKLRKQHLTAINNRLKFDLSKLHDPNILNNIRAELGGKFAPLLIIDQGVQKATDIFTSVLTVTAKSNLARVKSTRKPWVTQEALTACDCRQQFKAIQTCNKTDNNQYQEETRQSDEP